VQLSINALRPLDYHVDLAARLAPLRDQGVLIVASGNVVHNLREVEWKHPNAAFDWAERFDDAVVAQLADAPGDILKVREHPDFARAVPTPDHFIPLLYLAGLAAADDRRTEPIVRGYSMGSLSMTCHALGMRQPHETDAADAATLPRDIPPDQTNI
jgi:4,5-DOPA dioxygenase extradiol